MTIPDTTLPRDELANGAALAAFLAAGIGAFTMGVVVILSEAGMFPVPALYAPAGGVSSRTTVATVIWLLTWLILHKRWSGRSVNGSRVFLATLALIALGVLFLFPPIWKVL